MKKIILVLMLVFTCLISIGCNRQWIDTTYSFEKVIIELPNGKIIEGKCEGWRDYDNSDQLQVKVDGKVYLVHSSNVVLISE